MQKTFEPLYHHSFGIKQEYAHFIPKFLVDTSFMTQVYIKQFIPKKCSTESIIRCFTYIL